MVLTDDQLKLLNNGEKLGLVKDFYCTDNDCSILLKNLDEMKKTLSSIYERLKHNYDSDPSILTWWETYHPKTYTAMKKLLGI